MYSIENIFGVKAVVFLKFDGSIEELSTLLCNSLNITSFAFDTDQDPPHEVFGSAEVLGFEIWLNKSNAFEEFPFVIEMQTTFTGDEAIYDRMYDLSLWLARYISIMTKIDARVR